MLLESCSIEVFRADLTLYHYLWALSFDVLEQSSSCHILAVFIVTNVTSEFWTVVQGVLLKFPHCFPDDLTLMSWMLEASVGKFAKVNTVLKNFVNILHEAATTLTVWAH